MKFICLVSFCFVNTVLIYTTTDGASIHHKKHEDEVFTAEIRVHGNPRLHDELVIHVTTDKHEHQVTVSRVTHSVFDHDTEGFIVSGDDDGNTVFDMHKLPSHVHDHAKQFFSDINDGTIISVIHGSKGDVHVEGILNHIYIIAPPGSQRRHRRALKPDSHTLYKQNNESERSPDFLEVPKIFLDKSRWVGSFTQKPTAHPWSIHRKYFGNFLPTPRLAPVIGSRSLHGLQQGSFRPVPNTNPHSAVGASPRPRRRRQSSRDPAVAEVLVIIDKEMFKSFNFSMTELGLFLLHFWHAVDFKFRTLPDPQIRLKVRQYGAFQFGQYQPFIEESRIDQTSKQISLYDTLTAFRNWMKKYESNTNFVRHDIAVLQTGEDLCEKKDKGECSKQTSGIGFVSGACISARKFPGYTYDVAISEVGKSFKGVLVTVHEIGHLLGSHHDGEGNSKACSSKSGYVMSYQRDNAFNFSRFSDCSKTSIKHFLSSTWYSQCLRETSSDGYDFPSTLPGQYMTIEDQCRYYVDGTPCSERAYPLSERCERLCCEAKGYRIKRREPAVDGTDCGGDNVCYNGECVPKTDIKP
ncbi:A disintegrin and metalloproteinase with thrombospondin motifs like [Haliotis cracherodii]|uniref:A disintegrin and metalloproteinase with thrombospondin motifs like n=1 Tax=Haliotis cracherodii TaxID=6455 RepID=UPI0039EB6E67